MSTAVSGKVDVRDAVLYYTVRGSGPPILILPSGGGDAHCADRLVSHLSATNTVLTYDRRGQTRTTVRDSGLGTTIEEHCDDVSRPRRTVRDSGLGTTIEEHCDDVSRLLESVGAGPVAVLGCSTGAVIGLDLVRRHGGQVRLLVAHEPPLRDLVTAAEQEKYDQAHREVRRLYRHMGWQAALRRLREAFDDPGRDPLDREDDVPWEPPDRRTVANLHSFLAQEAIATWSYRLDHRAREELRSSATTIVPAVGRDRHTVTGRCAALLAEAIGEQLVAFPGAHEGYLTHPRAFAVTLLGLVNQPCS